jgi:circadian clock protein KaiC
MSGRGRDPMKKPTLLPRITTGVRNLDALFDGGIPKGTVSVLAGPPGSGKTILAQQICFHNASSKNRALYFSTLTEPTAKTLRYLAQFTFFDPEKLDNRVRFVDLGVILRSKGLEPASSLIMDQVRQFRPAVVVIQLQGLRRSGEVARRAAQVRLRDRGQFDGLGDDDALARRIQRGRRRK